MTKYLLVLTLITACDFGQEHAKDVVQASDENHEHDAQNISLKADGQCLSMGAQCNPKINACCPGSTCIEYTAYDWPRCKSNEDVLEILTELDLPKDELNNSELTAQNHSDCTDDDDDNDNAASTCDLGYDYSLSITGEDLITF
jgi:hypothetical protein